MVTALVTIIMFLVMISLHEFGHFITAKLMGFKILEYAIGFGPAIWKSKKSDIQYSLRIIPFGGYCKFEGEDEDSKDERAFSNQPVWKRIIVVAAGGLCNVVLGFLLFLVIIPFTSPISTNYVKDVVPNSFVQEAGLMPNDKIIEINGKKVSFYNDITLYTREFNANTECSIIVKRDGEKYELNFKPTQSEVTFDYGEDGIRVSESINGEPADESFYKYGDGAERNEELIGKSETIERLIIGFVPVQEEVNALNIWKEAWNETKFVVKLVYNSLWQMVTGRVGVEQMSGPVGVVSEINTAVNSGRGSWLYILNLTALLTINLGIFNLLPIPALDGGRLFFMLIELVTRKRIPPEKEGMVHTIGFMLLIGLIIFISYNDILKLLK
ncbi:MAG: site-2 protease family protein [Clostridia bacterium]|nr:site-2 protease family protein [Clostridia bacterium]